MIKFLTGFVVAFFGPLAVLNTLEIQLGFEPSVTDSVDLWCYWRSKISSDQIVIIGDSHTQLGLDLEVLSQNLGKKTIQLSVDGDDPWWFVYNRCAAIKNSIIIVSADQSSVNSQKAEGMVKEYEEYYDKRFSVDKFFNAFFWGILQENFCCFHDRLSLKGVLTRTISRSQMYLRTFFSRERSADYLLLNREDIRKAKSESLTKAFAEMKIKSDDEMISAVQALNKQLEEITKNNNKVVLVSTPLNGVYREAHDRLFPKAKYWDKIGFGQKNVLKIHYLDNAVLKSIEPFEFSHLDKREKSKYTLELVEIIKNAF